MSNMASSPKSGWKTSTLNSHSSSHRNSITQARSLTQSFSSLGHSLGVHAAGPLTPALLGSLRGAVVAQQAGVQALKDISKWHSQIQVRTAGGKKAVLEKSGLRKSCNASQLHLKQDAPTKCGVARNFNRSQVSLGKKPDYNGSEQPRPSRMQNLPAKARAFASQIDSLPGSIMRNREETPVPTHLKRPVSLNSEFLNSFEFRDNCCEPSSLHSSLRTAKPQQKRQLLAAQRLHYHSKNPLH